MRWEAWLIGVLAFSIAAIGAKPFAGAWNDGSRLAAAESLLDRGTLAIDDSIFCKPPRELIEAGMPPFDPRQPGLLLLGTYDKLFVKGRFYSDKPAIASVLMAAVYVPLMWGGVPSPLERPDLFCYLMTLFTSGLGYAVAVGCMASLGQRLGLTPRWRFIWLASFALSTFALTYTQYVNAHAMQLGVLAAIALVLAAWEDRLANGRSTWKQILTLGILAGIGFNLDFGSGPPLVAILFAFVAWKTRSLRAIAIFSLGALPWVAAGMGINYAIGGVIKPLNMYPEHFRFPGSPFTEENLTGFLRHSPLDQFLYGAGMMLGKRGFLNHNLPLLLLFATGWSAVRTPGAGRDGLRALLCWCLATWLMYALLSNNMGGACCSVRWFMPFLAPGFWLLGQSLRDRPATRPYFAALSLWGGVLAGLMWWKGPWTSSMVPLLYPVLGLALLSCGIIAIRSRNRTTGFPEKESDLPEHLPFSPGLRKAA